MARKKAPKKTAKKKLVVKPAPPAAVFGLGEKGDWHPVGMGYVAKIDAERAIWCNFRPDNKFALVIENQNNDEPYTGLLLSRVALAAIVEAAQKALSQMAPAPFVTTFSVVIDDGDVTIK